MIFWLFWFIFLLAIVLAGFWYESTPWRFCRRCGYFWNIRDGKQYNYLPPVADGIAKDRTCPTCERH